MKWCEECKCEFEDFVEVCSDCGKFLILYEDGIEDKSYYEFEDFLLLTNCSNNNEANLLISLLESYGIKTNIRYEGSGSYLNILHSVNYQGVDVLVIPKYIDDAREILKEFKYSYTDSPDEYESKTLKKHRRHKKFIAYFIIFNFLFNILIGKFFELVSFLTKSN